MGRLSDEDLSALKQAAEAVEIRDWTHDDCGLVLEADNPDRVVANMGQWWYVNEPEMLRRQARTRFIGTADPATVLALVEEVERYRALERNSRGSWQRSA